MLNYIRLILTPRECKLYAVLSSVIFLILYAFGIGIIFQTPYPLPSTFPTPRYEVILEGPIGQVPWVIIYLNRNWIFSINLEAGVVAFVLSLLVGLNIASIVYHSKYGKYCGVGRKFSLVGVLPSFFAMFSCCGSGLIFLILFTTGLGGLWSSILLPYSSLLVMFAIAILLLNLYLGYRRLARG